MMEKKRYRTDDSVELSFRKFMKLVDAIGSFLIVAILSVSFISGIVTMSQMNSESILPVLLGLAFGAVVSVVIWIVMKLINLVLTYITDIHYYSRTQMEVALETAGIEIAEPGTESWTCENCGKAHGNDVSFCTHCGTKKPEKD